MGSTPPTIFRMCPDDKSVEEGVLEIGPEGLALGRFGEEIVATEVPNLLLKPILGGVKLYKRPASNKLFTKPAIRDRATAAASSPATRIFGLEYYKDRNVFGIRERTGKKRTVGYVGGKASSKTKDQLQEIATKAIEKFAGEEQEADVCAWIQEMV